MAVELPTVLQAYAYKQLCYRYWGRDYHFSSSQELFSASQIDRGSQLLLNSLLPKASTSAESGPLQALLEAALQREADGKVHGEAHAGGEAHLDIWDWGCGIGVLGIMAQGYLRQLLTKQGQLLQRQASPEIQRLERLKQLEQLAGLGSTLHVWDRDALALAFTEANWLANQAASVRSASPAASGSRPRGEELGLQACLQADLQVHTELFGAAEPSMRRPLLVLSNIPAKVGEPVLRALIPALASHGYVALVIVAPLRHLVEDCAERGQIEIVWRSGSGDHSVFHYCAAAGVGDASEFGSRLPEPLELYRRAESRFCVERRGKALRVFAAAQAAVQAAARPAVLSWGFRSAYGLHDFDQPSFALQLQLRLLAQRNWGGRVLLWEPNHGHVACFLALKPGSRVQHIDFAGRNRLALLFSEYNLQQSQAAAQRVETVGSSLLSLPCLEALPPEHWHLLVLALPEKLSAAGAQALCSWLEGVRALANAAEAGPSKTWLCLQGKSARKLDALKAWSLKEELRSSGELAQLWHN